MNKDRAYEVLVDAARSWQNELVEYVIPADEHSDDPDAIETTHARRQQVADIDKAIAVLRG